MDPLPEDEDDEDVLPELTNLGRVVIPSCIDWDPSEGRNLLSAEKREEESEKLCRHHARFLTHPRPVMLEQLSRQLSRNELAKR